MAIFLVFRSYEKRPIHPKPPEILGGKINGAEIFVGLSS